MEKYLKSCEMSYGYAKSWGWQGIGVIYYDDKDVAIWFDDDNCYMNEDEVIFNDFMRANILEVIK